MSKAAGNDILSAPASQPNSSQLMEQSEFAGAVMKKELNARYQFRSHMDIVRGVSIVTEIDSIATVSEDCTVKLWNLKDCDNIYQENDGNLEPYITLRGHTGPLFSVASSG